MSSMYSDGYATYDTVGGIAATDAVLEDGVPTDAEGAQERAVGVQADDKALINRAWVLIVVVGLGGLWLLGLLFKGHISG